MTASTKSATAQGWAEARALLWTHRRRLAVGMVLMVVSRVSDFVLPAMSKYFIDDVLVQQRWDLLPRLAAATAVATVVGAAATFMNAQVLGVTAQKAITEMRRRVHAHVLRLPVREFDHTNTGVLISRVMSDAEGVRNLVGTGIVQLSGSMLTAVVAFAVLMRLNWRLTCVTALILGTFGIGITAGFKRLRPLLRERGQIQAEVTGRLAEALSGVRIVKAYTAERREALVFARGVHRLLRNVARGVVGTSAVVSISSLVVGACGIALMLIGGASIRAGTMTVGDLVMYLAFTALMTMPILQLASVGTQITEALAGLDRIRELRALDTEAADEDTRQPCADVHGRVEFDGVCFEYTRGVSVLTAVSFSAPAGSTTALVGSSGSGKSTLISLVMAFNRPTAGRILVDGRDLATLRLRDYRGHLGVVLQESFLFDGTIADNIRYACPDATDAEVERAGRIAHCDEFVGRFGGGYATVVGERGVRLSGGQRQRVAIARAVLADPRVLILDEATSSLDSECEALIQDGLRSLRRGRTTFVIAHRLSTIRSADQILVVEQGAIVERGTHDELLARGGRYRELYDNQYRFERERFVNPGEELTPEPVRVAARAVRAQAVV